MALGVSKIEFLQDYLDRNFLTILPYPEVQFVLTLYIYYIVASSYNKMAGHISLLYVVFCHFVQKKRQGIL